MEKQLGSEAKVSLELINGNVKLSAKYDGKGADAEVSITLDSDYLIDQIAKLIPGDSAIEQGALALLKAGLKKA